MLVLSIPVITAAQSQELPSIDDKAVLYTPCSDYKGGYCVITSCKSMLRRFAITHGSKKWNTITNKAIQPFVAPSGGMKYTSDYSNDGINYHIEHGYFKGNTEASKKRELKQLLKEHPEGVIVWGQNAIRSGPHAVLAVKIKDGVVYAVDSSYNRGYPSGNSYSMGIQKWANTTMLSFNRISKYWRIKSTTGESTSAGGNKVKSNMSISDVTTPSTVKKGNGFTIRGMIQSNYRITEVLVEIVNSKGKAVISKKAEPDAWMYDVYGLDSVVKFGTLPAGTFTYKITATDEKKTAVLHENTFKIKGKNTPADTNKDTDKSESETNDISALKITGATVPDTLKKGDPFPVRGKITSDVKIKSVEISVINSAGDAVLYMNDEPGKKSYDVSAMDAYLKFGTLAAGKYRYVISATDKKQSLDLVDEEFTVKAAKKKTTLKIKSYTAPKKLAKGSPFIIKGKITSKYKIKKVQILIRDSSGNNVLSASAKPNKKKYDLRKLDPKIKFGQLSKGKYIYMVKAKNSKGTTTLVKKTFKVV